MTRVTRLSSVRRWLVLAAPLLVAPVFVALAQGTPTVPELKYETPDPARAVALTGRCQGCHGNEWQGGRGPALKGKEDAYIRSALAAYRAKVRPHPGMQGVAANLTDQNIADIAALVTGSVGTAAVATPATAAPVSATPGAPSATPAVQASAGQKLYLDGDASRDLLACAVCHGEDGKGEENRLGVPAIAGKSVDDISSELRKYRAMPAAGIAHPDAMRIAAKPLTDADIAALAAYVAGLK